MNFASNCLKDRNKKLPGFIERATKITVKMGSYLIIFTDDEIWMLDDKLDR